MPCTQADHAIASRVARRLLGSEKPRDANDPFDALDDVIWGSRRLIDLIQTAPTVSYGKIVADLETIVSRARAALRGSGRPGEGSEPKARSSSSSGRKAQPKASGSSMAEFESEESRPAC